MIPGVLHQIWLGDLPFPEEFAAYQRTWLERHPDWVLRFWTEDTLPDDLTRDEVYDRRRSPAERADIARLELLHRHGGVYVDTDFECLRPIAPLLEGVEFFTAYLKHNKRVNNAFFGATPGHPLLAKALAEAQAQEIGGLTFDKNASGALFFDRLVRHAEGVTIYSSADFYPTTPSELERAFAVHHAARSWKTAEDWRKTALLAEERLEKAQRQLETERQAHLRTKASARTLEEELARARGVERAAPPDQPTSVIAKRRPGGRGDVVALDILFFLRGIHFSRMFEHFMRTMLERGHRIHVALSTEKRGLGDDKSALFEEFASTYPAAFSYEMLPQRRDRWLVPAVAIRHALDYLRYLEPEYASAAPLRDRAQARAPRLVRALLRVPGMRTAPMRGGLSAVLRRVEAAIPVPKALTDYVRRNDPDVVLVAPLVGLGSTETDFVRAAASLAVPTVLPVASWDNLTNKGLLHDVPTLTVVWNDAQVDEAVRLQGVPRERVVAVGAHSFDHWFRWQPSTTREEFAAMRGIDPDQPLVLYLGSSFFITGDETVFMREWLERLRAHPRLTNANVIFRPHPYNVVGWSELDIEEPGSTVIWPRVGEAPTDDAKRTEFFDTLYHASAVVGLNTSAQIEAAIVGRPVLTLVSDHFQTQEGTLHFGYIADSGDGDGFVRVARSWEQHLDQLAAAIDDPATHRERGDAFVRAFIRPHGIDRPAAPTAVDAVERAAHTSVGRRRAGLVLPVLLRLLTPLLGVLLPIFQPRRTARTLSKITRKNVKQMRKARRNLAKRRKASHGVVKQPKPQAATPLTRKEERKQARAAAKGKEARDGGDDLRSLLPPVEAAAERPKAKPAKAVVAKKRKKASLSKRRQQMTKRMRRRWKYLKRDVRNVYNMRNRRTYASTVSKLPSRNELPVLLNSRGLVGDGAEIGVKTGKFSDQLLRVWRCRRLISIDPWLSASHEEYDDRSNVSQEQFEDYCRETRDRLAPYGERSEIWRLKSVEAAERVEDRSLDFVYIDARHDYESVLEDLDAWLPKVKPGGIIAGHDYADGDFIQGKFGVKSAVDEFFGELGLPVHGTEGPSAVELFPTWVVEIPVEGVAYTSRAAADREPVAHEPLPRAL